MKAVVTYLINSPDAFFIGRGQDYAFSLEGALKLKEISYIHAEAYAAGELKHGTIALISENVPVIATVTQDHIFAKAISNVREVKARGAFVILITKEGVDIEHGSLIRLHHYPGRGRYLYRISHRRNFAAHCVLCFSGQKPGCRSAKKPGKIGYRRIIVMVCTVYGSR